MSSIPDWEREQLVRAIKALPQAWQTELQDIVETLTPMTANILIDRIRQQDAVLADVLEELMKNYRFDLLQTLFQEA
jgi:hypothetical protein